MSRRAVCFRAKRGGRRRGSRIRRPAASRIRPRTSFTEKRALHIATCGEFRYLPAVDTSRQKTYSFAVVNKGEHAVAARVEISPDRVHYASDTEEIVPGGRTAVLVPMRFLRFTRIGLRSVETDETSKVDVYFQAQSAD